MGSKAKITKYIVPIIQRKIDESGARYYVEPFAGGCNVIDKIKAEYRIASDSQFFELKKYSALQIAGAFGIKPNQINDYEKSSYANSEMQNISFYIDTELFILKQYEEELDYKLLEPSDRRQGKYYKFNENVILRTDAKSQATILTGYVQNGIYTPNEARSYMDKPRKEGGDELICNGNYIKVAQIGIEEKEGRRRRQWLKS